MSGRLIVCVLLISACGGSTPPPPAPASEPAAVKMQPSDWPSFDFAGRGRYMKEVVLPHMQKVFVEYDPQRFRKFTCETCHGEGVKNRDFKMPAQELIVVPKASAQLAALAKKKPEWVGFMMSKVTPQMAALLGKEGSFNCNGCHAPKLKRR